MNASKTNYPAVSIVLLTFATAVIHIFLGVTTPGMFMFVLNGVGFLALLAAYRLDLPVVRERRGLVRWAFMGYTAVTILAWVAIGDKSLPAGMLGYITKLIELALLALLWLDKPKR